jgi:WD40 repeat protein
MWKVGDTFSAESLEPVDVQRGVGWAVAFSPDGRQIATARADGSVVLGDVDPKGIRFRLVMPGHRGFVFTVAFSPDGERLASGGTDGTIRIWDVAKGTLAFQPLIGHQKPVARVAFSPDGRLLASAGHDGGVRLWDLSTGQLSGQPLVGHRDLVTSVDFSPDGAMLASSGRDGSVLLWSIESRGLAREPLKGHRGGVNRALFISARPNGAVTPLFDGSLLASAGDDGNVVLWRLRGGGQIVRQVGAPERSINAVMFDPGNRFIAASSDQRIDFLDPESGSTLGKPIVVSGYVAALALSADGSLLASGTLNGTIQLWNTQTHTEHRPPLVGHRGFIHSLAFSPDAHRLASAGEDGVIVWDLATGAAAHELLDEHQGDVYSVAYSHDGRFLVSGGRDRTIVVRDATTLSAVGEPLAAASRFQGRVRITSRRVPGRCDAEDEAGEQ